MKILFTGATGFVGSHIRKETEKADNEIMFLIAEGEEFTPKSGNSIVIKADLRDLAKIKDAIKSFGPEACIHCAWQGIPDYGEEMSKLNLFNSIALMDLLFKETGCKKAIISGSCLEYGKIKGVCRESETGKPNRFFAWAKQSLYSYADLLASKNDRALIWFRMFYVYGPGQRKGSLIPSIVSSFQKGEKPDINRPFNANDFIYMADAAKAYRTVLEKEIASGIYNLGSGKATRVSDICRLVEQKITGSDLVTKEIEGKCDKRQDVNFYADITKTRKQTGWAAKTTIKEGIEMYIKNPDGEK